MHFALIAIALLIASGVRLFPMPRRSQSWTAPLLQFLLPQLLLLSTALAVSRMGMGGEMFGLAVGWLGCHLAQGFLIWAGALLLWRLLQAWRSLLLLKNCSTVEICGVTGRILETSALFAACIGLWNSHLVISRGLVTQFSLEQLEAVLAHESAHRAYRDPFWFFLLGWLGSFTAWLPSTNELWQELLLQRELRADRNAAQQVDPLVLAESLLKVVQSSLTAPSFVGVAFSDDSSLRIEQRIDALLSMQATNQKLPLWFWPALLLSTLPLLTPLLHHASLMHL